MPKQKKKTKASGIYPLTTLRLVKLAGQPMTIPVKIPAKVVPFFVALSILHEKSPEDFAVWALCQGLTSEEAVQKFDDVLNEAL